MTMSSAWSLIPLNTHYCSYILVNTPVVYSVCPWTPAFPSADIVVEVHKTCNTSSTEPPQHTHHMSPFCFAFRRVQLIRIAHHTRALIRLVAAAVVPFLFLLLRPLSRRGVCISYDAQDDDEPVDPLTGIREKCGETKACAATMSQYKVRDTHT